MVSVIIPSYNNAQWLASCLDSCLDQKLLKEIIVVDNFSTDGSMDILLEYKNTYPEKIVLLQNPIKGANYSRNLGFAHSTGKYIQWLDSDDRILPNKFELQIQAIEQHSADIAYSDWQMDFYESSTGKFIRSDIKKNQAYEDFLFEILLNKRWSSPNTYLVKREMAEKLHAIEAWYPSRPVEQDREYISLAAILGAKFIYTPGIFAVYNRWSEQSISTISFEKRLEHSATLVHSLLDKISANIPFNNEKYLRILKTELLVSRYYHSDIEVQHPIYLKDVFWPMVHWKIRIPILLQLWTKKTKKRADDL